MKLAADQDPVSVYLGIGIATYMHRGSLPVFSKRGELEAGPPRINQLIDQSINQSVLGTSLLVPVLGFASLAREDGLRLADQKAKRASQPKKTITNPSRPRARRSRASHPLWMIPYALNNASLVLVFQACEKKNPAAAAVVTHALAAIRFFIIILLRICVFLLSFVSFELGII